MTTSRSDGDTPSLPPAQAVRVLRVDPGQKFWVRMLSESYGGCNTHYIKGRSEYCRGKDCPAAMHHVKIQWKGYCAAEYFVSQFNAWVPTVLELTEHAELDMRGVYARGQVWLLSREESKKGKHSPVCASLERVLDGAELPGQFDILRVLVHVYHTQPITLNVPNPLPPRLILPASPNHKAEAKEPLQRPNKAFIRLSQVEKERQESKLCDEANARYAEKENARKNGQNHH